MTRCVFLSVAYRVAFCSLPPTSPTRGDAVRMVYCLLGTVLLTVLLARAGSVDRLEYC